MESLEQELIVMLRRLPVPVIITWRSGLFHWQCAEGNGTSPYLVSATEQALCFLIRSLTTNAETGKNGGSLHVS